MPSWIIVGVQLLERLTFSLSVGASFDLLFGELHIIVSIR